MLRIFILSILLLGIQSLRPYVQVQPDHQSILHHDQTDAKQESNLTQDEKKWDSFYRKSIPAIGKSKIQSISKTSNGGTEIKYKDTYENNDFTQWIVLGNGDLNNKLINQATQIKTERDKDDKRKIHINKSTYKRKQTVLALSQETYK